MLDEKRKDENLQITFGQGLSWNINVEDLKMNSERVLLHICLILL